MATKRNDTKGYERGARGIDGKDGEGFDRANVDWSAIEGMFGRNYGHNKLSGGLSDITAPNMANNDKGGRGKSSGATLFKSAVGGQRRAGK